jgi:hypothetical protein
VPPLCETLDGVAVNEIAPDAAAVPTRIVAPPELELPEPVRAPPENAWMVATPDVWPATNVVVAMPFTVSAVGGVNAPTVV